MSAPAELHWHRFVRFFVKLPSTTDLRLVTCHYCVGVLLSDRDGTDASYACRVGYKASEETVRP